MPSLFAMAKAIGHGAQNPHFFTVTRGICVIPMKKCGITRCRDNQPMYCTSLYYIYMPVCYTLNQIGAVLHPCRRTILHIYGRTYAFCLKGANKIRYGSTYFSIYLSTLAQRCVVSPFAARLSSGGTKYRLERCNIYILCVGALLHARMPWYTFLVVDLEFCVEKPTFH